MKRFSPLARRLAACAVSVAVLVALDGAAQSVMAQNPFGGPRPAPGSEIGGLVGWILSKQSEFYREISAALRLAKSDGSAVWSLLAVSFAYGIFHAAGPGHGKAVSFASALMQSLVAITVVAVIAWLLNATAKTMCGAEKAIEIGSYALIAAFGASLVWTKGGRFMRALQATRPEPALAVADHGHRHGHAHDHGDGHVHDDHCGHSHGPAPEELAGPGGWRRGLAAVLSVGIRPCSGAILVLVFALAQGLFWAGIAATLVMGLGTAITVAIIAVVAVSARDLARRLSEAREGSGVLIMRGIEFGAAGLVLLFGSGLLLGYIT